MGTCWAQGLCLAGGGGGTDPQMAAAVGPWPQPMARQALGPGDPALLLGSHLRQRPLPCCPHQPFHFQLDLLLSHGNGMQIGLRLPGSRLRPASRSPSLGGHTLSNRVASSPQSEGVPLSPHGVAATLCPGRPSPLLTHERRY